MRTETALRRLVLAGTAVCGVVLAHALGYVAVFADSAERAHHLHETGHGYWTGAVALACSGAAVAVGLSAWWGVRRALGVVGKPSGSWPVLGFVPLAIAQLGLFAGMEVAERLLAGSDIAALAHGPLFAVGLLAQIVVAAIAVVVLRVIACGSERLASRHRRRPRPMPLPTAVATHAFLPARLSWGPAGCRGPPGLLPT